MGYAILLVSYVQRHYKEPRMHDGIGVVVYFIYSLGFDKSVNKFGHKKQIKMKTKYST